MMKSVKCLHINLDLHGRNVNRIVFFLIMILLGCRTDREIAFESYKNGDYEKAFKKYEKIEEKNEILANELVFVGSMYLDLNKRGLAALYFKKAIDKEPKNYLAHFNLGYLYELEGSYDDALNYYYNSMNYQKETKIGIYLVLARTYDKMKDYDNALKYYKTFLEKYDERIPRNDEVLDDYFQEIEFAKSYIQQNEVKIKK